MEKTRLTMSFFEFSMQFYKGARIQSAQLCRDLSEAGRKKVVLLGAGELAEITYLGIQEWKLELASVIRLKGEKNAFMGMKTIESLREAENHDAVIICSYDPLQPTSKNYLPEGVEISKKMVWIFS
jgi:hypothetical protein